MTRLTSKFNNTPVDRRLNFMTAVLVVWAGICLGLIWWLA